MKTSDVKGVSFDARNNLWKVSFREFYLGSFPIEMRDLAERLAADARSRWQGVKVVPADEFRDLRDAYMAEKRARRQQSDGEVEPIPPEVLNPPVKISPATAKPIVVAEPPPSNLEQLIAAAQEADARHIQLMRIADEACREAEDAGISARVTWDQVGEALCELGDNSEGFKRSALGRLFSGEENER